MAVRSVGRMPPFVRRYWWMVALAFGAWLLIDGPGLVGIELVET